MHTSASAKQIQQAHVDWLCELPLDIALTLNFKANIHENQARIAARHFWRLIDIKVLGENAVKRHGAKLTRVCTLEGQQGVSNWHYHAAVQLPANWHSVAFHDLLLSTWEGLGEAGKYSLCKAIHDRAGWLNYICKGAKEQRDVLCLVTSHIPQTP